MSKTREQLRQELVEAFQNARKVTIGNKLFIGNDAEIEPIIARALKRGETVTEGCVSRWIEFSAKVDYTKSGSDRYIWDSTGNKVLAEKFIVTQKVIHDSIDISREYRGEAFIKWENV